ncbi:MAG: YncE family protein [Bacteroidota bacterium]
MKKLFALSILFLSCTSHAQKSGYKLSNTFHIQSAGGWDYLAANPATHKLYVSHGTQVNILDQKTGDSLGVILNTPGVHGIAFVDAVKKGYISNGRSNNLTVFDYTTDQVTTQIATGQNPDAIMYDAFSKMIYVCNGRSNDLTVINPIDNKVTATIALGGKPETAVSDNAGKLFINIEDKNEVVVVDTKSMKVLSHWPLGAGSPTGLCIDTKTHRLFVGCEKTLVVMNSSNGKVVKTIPIGDGCDGTAFDPATNLIFASNGEGTLSIIKELSADKYEKLEDLPTKQGARTIFLDEASHNVYLPAAEYEPQTDVTQRSRPKMIPGTFRILVLTK